MPSTAMSLKSMTPPANGPLLANGEPGLFGAMAEAVVHRATLRIAQHLVRRVELLETDRRLRVVRVPIRMVLRRELPEGGLDLLRGRALRSRQGSRSGRAAPWGFSDLT